MKHVLLGLLAALGLSSCTSGGGDPLAGTIGTGNTAGVAGVKLIGAGSEIGAKVYIYKADQLVVPVDTTRTDAQGNYHFDSLPVGSYKVFLDQNGLAGAFQDVVIKENATVNTTVELRPYVILHVDSSLNGYCGVGANVLVSSGTGTLVRVPQQMGSFALGTGTASDLSVAWDSVKGVSSLTKAGSVVFQEAIAAHAGLLLATPISKQYDAGVLSVWAPPAGGYLRVSVAFTLTKPLGDTASLITFGDAFSVQLNDTSLVLNDGVSKKLMTGVARGVPQYIELILDGSTGELSGAMGSIGSLSILSLPPLQVTGLSNASGHLLVGNRNSFQLLHGASVDLVKSTSLTTPRVESDN